MQSGQQDASGLAAGEGWESIHLALERSQRSLYLAGTASILLLWGALTAIYFFFSFALGELFPQFVDDYPWYPGPVWAVLGTVGMFGSMFIGHRSSRRNADGVVARNAGIRVLLYWLAVVTAAVLIPGAAGLWSPGQSENIPNAVFGVICLGYVLFGILYRPALAVVGVGMAAALFAPGYLAGDWAGAVSGIAILAVCGMGAAWIRRSGLP